MTEKETDKTERTKVKGAQCFQLEARRHMRTRSGEACTGRLSLHALTLFLLK